MKKINILLSIVLILIIAAAVIVFIKLNEKLTVIEVEKEREYTEFEKKGGTQIVLEPDVEDLNSISVEDMEKAKNIISSRIKSRYPDATVSVFKKTAIYVQVPGEFLNDETNDILSHLSALGMLEFSNADGEVIMNGSSEFIKSASAKYGQLDELSDNVHYVQINLTGAGRKAFKAATEAAANAGSGKNFISISLDGVIQTSPSVNEVIDDDSCIISGNYTAEDARAIADLINSGSLPFTLTEVEVSRVTPIVK